MSVVFQNFVWGPLSDKFQRRRTLIISGEILAGIGTISVWFVHSLFTNLLVAGYVVIIGLSCIEAFWSMSNIGWSALISDIYPSVERSRVIGQLTSIGGIGRIIGITIGGILYDFGFGFRNGPIFFVASIVMFVSAVPMLFTPEGGISYAYISNEESEIELKITPNYKFVFSIFIISLMFVNFGRNSIVIPYSQYLTLENGFNVDSVLLSYIANMRSVAVLLIGLIAGLLSKRFGHSRAFFLGIIFAIIALLLTALSNTLFFIFIGSFLFGTAEVIIMASSYAFASELIPKEKRGKLFGVYNTTFFLSWGMACTVISGPLIDIIITETANEIFAYQTAFLVGALICLLGALTFIFLQILTRITQRRTNQITKPFQS
jgi:MFS family permease